MKESPRQRGNAFEDMFERLLRYQGFLPLKNRLTVRVIGKGKYLPEKSQLDYTIIQRTGEVGFFDCKSYEGDSFRFSQITKHQLDRAIMYNLWLVQAGFIVWFRKINQIVYFSGVRVKDLEGHSIGPSNGMILGPLENFIFKKVFDSEIFHSGYY